MDTRRKIIDWSQAPSVLEQWDRRGSPLAVVTGYFDPLLAAHTRRLNRIAASAGRLAVILLNPPDPILPPQDRAALVAALEIVEVVTIPPHETPLASLPTSFAARLESEDARCAADFIRHVHDRHAAS